MREIQKNTFYQPPLAAKKGLFKQAIKNLIKWKLGYKITIPNIKGRGKVSLKRTSFRNILSPSQQRMLTLDISYNKKHVGRALVTIKKHAFVVKILFLKQEDAGIGKTILNWLSWQAQREKKHIIYNTIGDEKIVYIIFKVLTDIKTEENGKWVTRPQKTLLKRVRLFLDKKNPEAIKESVRIRGKPKPTKISPPDK